MSGLIKKYNKKVTIIEKTDYITVDGEQINLGWFYFEDQAALAYNKAARKYFGKFAYLNKIKRNKR
jgi:hypothetical protein